MPTPSSLRDFPVPAMPAPATPAAGSPAPIGVFDSGVGGLTVAAALRRLLPGEPIYYIGDTARVPYGGKSQATIERYSAEISALLLAGGAKMIVAACNTASALALPRLEAALPVPVVGVIRPGARAAVAATRNGHVGVIGTRGTVRSGAYERAIHALAPDIRVTSRACPMLVPAIEEGWLESRVTDAIIAEYLGDLPGLGIDTLVLGCTHYPLLKPALARFLGGGIRLVDSAENCAVAVRELLEKNGIAAGEGSRAGEATRPNPPAEFRVALTDTDAGFLPVAQRALGLELGPVGLVDVAR